MIYVPLRGAKQNTSVGLPEHMPPGSTLIEFMAPYSIYSYYVFLLGHWGLGVLGLAQSLYYK